MSQESSFTAAEIAEQIRPALTKLYVMYFRMAEQSELTGPQLSMLTRLRENGESRISQLAREEGIRMPTASNALHLLENRGYVERLRDSEDRRGVRVRLTDEGNSALNRVGQERTEYLTTMLDSLPDELLQKAPAAIEMINALAETFGNQAAHEEN